MAEEILYVGTAVAAAAAYAKFTPHGRGLVAKVKKALKPEDRGLSPSMLQRIEGADYEPRDPDQIRAEMDHSTQRGSYDLGALDALVQEQSGNTPAAQERNKTRGIIRHNVSGADVVYEAAEHAGREYLDLRATFYHADGSKTDSHGFQIPLPDRKETRHLGALVYDALNAAHLIATKAAASYSMGTQVHISNEDMQKRISSEREVADLAAQIAGYVFEAKGWEIETTGEQFLALSQLQARTADFLGDLVHDKKAIIYSADMVGRKRVQPGLFREAKREDYAFKRGVQGENFASERAQAELETTLGFALETGVDPLLMGTFARTLLAYVGANSVLLSTNPPSKEACEQMGINAMGATRQFLSNTYVPWRDDELIRGKTYSQGKLTDNTFAQDANVLGYGEASDLLLAKFKQMAAGAERAPSSVDDVQRLLESRLMTLSRLFGAQGKVTSLIRDFNRGTDERYRVSFADLDGSVMREFYKNLREETLQTDASATNYLAANMVAMFGEIHQRKREQGKGYTITRGINPGVARILTGAINRGETLSEAEAVAAERHERGIRSLEDVGTVFDEEHFARQDALFVQEPAGANDATTVIDTSRMKELLGANQPDTVAVRPTQKVDYVGEDGEPVLSRVPMLRPGANLSGGVIMKDRSGAQVKGATGVLDLADLAERASEIPHNDGSHKATRGYHFGFNKDDDE